MQHIQSTGYITFKSTVCSILGFCSMWPVRKKGHFADKGACYAQVVRKIGHFADKCPCYALAVRKFGHFADKGPCYALPVRKTGHFADCDLRVYIRNTLRTSNILAIFIN